MVERVELRTERLLLRPFALGDVDDVLAYASDDEFRRYYLAAEVYTRQSAEQEIARRVNDAWEAEAMFAIGEVYLTRFDAHNQTAELGYGIAREHWGKGLTPEAACAVVDWGFPTFELAKVWARADLRNQRSWRVMEKLGMQREALLRRHYAERGERIDSVWYGLLREEWEAFYNRSS